LVGLDPNEVYLKRGDFVYVYQSIAYGWTYEIKDRPHAGYGIIVDVENEETQLLYLRSCVLVGVLINGVVGWYAPHEILRVSAGNISSN